MTSTPTRRPADDSDEVVNRSRRRRLATWLRALDCRFRLRWLVLAACSSCALGIGAGLLSSMAASLPIVASFPWLTIYPDDFAAALGGIAVVLYCAVVHGRQTAAVVAVSYTAGMVAALLAASPFDHSWSLTVSGHLIITTTTALAGAALMARLTTFFTWFAPILARSTGILRRLIGQAGGPVLGVSSVAAALILAITDVQPLLGRGLLIVGLATLGTVVVRASRRPPRRRYWILRPAIFLGIVPGIAFELYGLASDVPSLWERDHLYIEEYTKVVPSGSSMSPNSSSSDRTLVLDLKQVRMEPDAGGELRFLVGSAKNAETLVLRNLAVLIDDVQPLVKYEFPGQLWPEMSPGQFSPIVRFSSTLEPKRGRYDLYSLANGSQPLVYQKGVVPDVILINLQSKPGYAYVVSAAFEWSRFGVQGTTTPPGWRSARYRLAFPRVVAIRDTLPQNSNEILLSTGRLGTAIYLADAVLPARRVVSAIVRSEDLMGHGAFQMGTGRAIELIRDGYLSVVTVEDDAECEEFVLSRWSALLVRRCEVDPDWDVLRRPGQSVDGLPKLVDRVTSPKAMQDYASRWAQQRQAGAQLLALDMVKEALVLDPTPRSVRRRRPDDPTPGGLSFTSEPSTSAEAAESNNQPGEVFHVTSRQWILVSANVERGGCPTDLPAPFFTRGAVSETQVELLTGGTFYALSTSACYRVKIVGKGDYDDVLLAVRRIR